MKIYDGRESFYQWDMNQKVTSDTFEVGDKIHFFNMRQTNALVVKAYELDGKIVADVPNILLQTAMPIQVYRYVYDEHSAQTIEKDTFNVEQRPQPYDYFYCETELYELRKEVDKAVLDATTAVGQLQTGLDNANEALELANKAEETSSKNEASRVSAEEERITSESQRVVAELIRKENEETRIDAESTRVKNENERVEAEEDRATSEEERKTSEAERVESENIRITAEEERVQNETSRKSAETTRVENETTRVNAEKDRVAKETARQTAETKRVENEAKRVVAETSRDEAEQERIANEEVRQANFEALPNNIGNAIKGYASGEVVRVDDVSPIEHIAKAKVSGKNLLNVDKLCTSNTILKNDDGSITVTPTAGFAAMTIATLGEIVPEITAGNIYTLTCDTTANNNYSKIYLLGSSSVWNFGSSRVVTEAELNDRIYLYSDVEGSATTLSNFQIELGDTATEYEPYIDPTTVTVTSCGKNLLPYPYQSSTKTLNGMTFIDNGDGSISLSGTPTDYSAFTLYKGKPLLQNGTITFSGVTTAKNILLTFAITTDGETIYNEVTNSTVFNLSDYPNATYWEIEIKRWINNTVVSGTVYPLLEIGESATNYETYNNSQTYTPSTDGTCDIVSLSPTMTLLTDTQGVNIDLEYNQDTNKTLGNIKDDLRELEDDVAEIILNGGNGGGGGDTPTSNYYTKDEVDDLVGSKADKTDLDAKADKTYVDKQVGDIETALDSIIAIQEELIGGGA